MCKGFMTKLLSKIRRKLLHLRLQPIRVFVFHQVSETFDFTRCFESDWSQIGEFKNTILNLQKHYSFVSLQEAYEKLQFDVFRIRKYAVLTSDDGYSSVRNIIPWLEEQMIPITLFINSQYLDGKHFMKELFEQVKELSPENREEEFSKGLYLTESEIESFNSRWVSVGMHGHEHVACNNMTREMFENQFLKCMSILKRFPGYIPFYAYTFGKHTLEQDEFLRINGIVPVGVDGQKNYNNASFIHRECIDKTFEIQ